MNEDIIKGKWQQLKGDVQKKWGKLTNDHLNQINGDRTKLAGLLQEKYGLAKDAAEKEIDTFAKNCDCNGMDEKKRSVR